MIEFQFYFNPADLYLKTHFPKNAVVPGSLVIDAFHNAIQREASNLVSFFPKVERFKLHQFIEPGTYQGCISKKNPLQLKEKGETVYLCELFQDKTLFASGKLIYEFNL